MSYKTIDVNRLLTGLVSENTLASYSLAWKQYMKFSKNYTNAITGVALAAWRQHLIVEGGYAANTVNLRIKAIKAIVKALYEIGELKRENYWDIKEVATLPENALRERRRPNNRTRVEPEQMRALCSSPAVSEENFVALRDRALMMTLATTGLRISEAVAVKINDLHEYPNDRYGIDNVMGKAQSDPRRVPLSAEAHSAILDWLAFRPINSPYIFTAISYSQEDGGILYSDKPINRSTASLHIREYAKSVGIEHFKPHDFRRFVGTQLAKSSLRVAQLVLGHKDITTTTRYYLLDEIDPGVTNSLF